jgi:wyosine [tRNA(Phe)-imidazoG37] synthetase (radical SAM superfamily)
LNEAAEHHIAFGPVPSRRLGQSLGINNIPAKACSYTCVYCQVGPTTEKIIEPRSFFAPAQIVDAVAGRVQKLRERGQSVDYLSFVPDGEPTLDQAIGESIQALQPLGIPIAVITNGTLLWRPEVRERLRQADLVSVKVDSARADAWRRINLPHRELALDTVLDGIRAFASGFTGTLITDTMLIAGINDSAGALADTADFLAGISPRTAYLAVPTRPTTVRKVRGTDERGLIRAYRAFAQRLPAVELLTGHEPGDFASTGDARTDLLATTAVHPMRERDVRRLLDRDQADWSLIQGLLADGSLKATEFDGERFFLRPIHRH